MPMSHIVLLSEACPTLPHLSTLFHKQHGFRERLLNVKYLFRFFLKILSETFLILRTERDIVMNVHWSSCKVPVILVRILSNLYFFQQIFEKSSNTKLYGSTYNETRVVPCGQTDMTN